MVAFPTEQSSAIHHHSIISMFAHLYVILDTIAACELTIRTVSMEKSVPKSIVFRSNREPVTTKTLSYDPKRRATAQ
jgi:hypothetical protein